MKTVNQLKQDITDWQNKTFGTQSNPISKIYHLIEEVKELLYASISLYRNDNLSEDESKLFKSNLELEFADCFMLLLGAASNANIDMDSLIELTYKKLEINKKRNWGKPDENGVCKHI